MNARVGLSRALCDRLAQLLDFEIEDLDQVSGLCRNLAKSISCNGCLSNIGRFADPARCQHAKLLRTDSEGPQRINRRQRERFNALPSLVELSCCREPKVCLPSHPSFRRHVWGLDGSGKLREPGVDLHLQIFRCASGAVGCRSDAYEETQSAGRGLQSALPAALADARCCAEIGQRRSAERDQSRKQRLVILPEFIQRTVRRVAARGDETFHRVIKALAGRGIDGHGPKNEASTASCKAPRRYAGSHVDVKSVRERQNQFSAVAYSVQLTPFLKASRV
ncbi:hypothetical protein ACVIYH_001246 [Bradyrhizobium diazoefficiens]